MLAISDIAAPVDLSNFVLDIHRDLSVAPRKRKPGPPERIDGMTVGLVSLSPDGPRYHTGEVHPDGDEILCLISRRAQVVREPPGDTTELRAGQACIVRKGEWHRVVALEPGILIYI